MPITNVGLQRLAQILWEIKGDRSTRKFALDVSCHHATISKMLTGKVIPDIHTLRKIANDCRSRYCASELVAILLEEPEAQEKPEQTVFTLESVLTAADTLPSEEKKQLMKLLFRGMTSREQRQLLQALINELV